MNEREHRAELRRFLKERRARITPREAGLPPGSRRRVPGLRREEVAALAGIGVSWYTTLENGDADGVSDATLLAVANALRLSDSEREYLAALTGRSPVATFETPDHLVIATMNALPFPAYIITSTWDVVDCNAAFRRIWAIGEHALPFNAVEQLFLNPAARRMHGPHFIANVRPVIAMLRSSQGRQPTAPSLLTLRDQIMADADLRAIWNDYEISSPLITNTCTIQTSMGPFCYTTLTLPLPGNSHGIVVQVPDTPSAERLKTVLGG